MSTANPVRDLAVLRSLVGEALLEPGDPGYDQARQVWNGAIQKRPAAILRARSDTDVRAAVDCAREMGLELAVHGGGHSLPGFCTTEGGLMLDLSLMNSVEVDPEARVARVEGGATWAAYDA